MKRFIIFFTLSLASLPLLSQLSTSLIIRSGMVVQRNQNIPVWGEGNSGKKVMVGMNGQNDSTEIASDGTWKLFLPAMTAGGPYTMTISSDGEELQYTDVYVGDVWLASGQSNMQWTLGNSLPPDENIDISDNQEIRQFNVTRITANNSSETIPAGSAWTPATSENTGNFTAVGYYFAKYLYADLGIPIGIIHSSYGGSRLESWMSQGMLGFDEQDILFSDKIYQHPTLLYNAMLHPLRHYPVKGFIWYQGESNIGSRETAMMYGDLFKTMIKGWRELWGLGDLPFFWVQLPGWGTPSNEDSPGSWDALPLQRESQSTALELPNTGEATGIDLGEDDVHPVNKQPFGERLALAARKIAYGEDIQSSGPRYKSHRLLSGGKVEISFDHAEGGLVAEGVSDSTLKWFSIVTESGGRYKASARIENDKVIVWNDLVPDPYVVRYAWESYPTEINFYNKAGLPAVPFILRVDDPGLSIGLFSSNTTNIDRGESVLLRWETFGSDSLTVNGIAVDRKSGRRVWPVTDSTFTLKIVDPIDETIVKTSAIDISVRQPIPTVQIDLSSGEVLPLDSAVTVKATVTREGGGPIARVEFYQNGQELYTDQSDPFKYTWIPDTTGEFTISAIVYNDLEISNTSNTLSFLVKKLTFKRYEAEDASYTYGSRIIPDTKASEGKYIDIMNNLFLEFDSIENHVSGLYPVYISYLMNYGSPRVQNLEVNNVAQGSIEFTAPDMTSWQQKILTIPLDSGYNTLRIDGVWNYMSFDYIDVGAGLIDPVIDTSTIDTTNISIARIKEFPELNCYPNPSRGEIYVDLYLKASGNITLVLMDLQGRVLENIYSKEMPAGRHQKHLTIPGAEGVYFLKLQYEEYSQVRKLYKLLD